jgi:hypothetical protein
MTLRSVSQPFSPCPTQRLGFAMSYTPQRVGVGAHVHPDMYGTQCTVDADLMHPSPCQAAYCGSMAELALPMSPGAFALWVMAASQSHHGCLTQLPQPDPLLLANQQLHGRKPPQQVI